MSDSILVSVFSEDRAGLVAAITGRLFELGANLGDANFSILGAGAEFNAVCDIPPGMTGDQVAAQLRNLPELGAGAEVNVKPFALTAQHDATAEITHRIVVAGGDQPGLVARLCETFGEFGANIVTLYAGRAAGGNADTYAIRLAVWIPPENVDTCLATVANTAGNLQLDCSWEAS